MDVWGCQAPETLCDRVMFYVIIWALRACWFLGLPFIVLVAFGVIG